MEPIIFNVKDKSANTFFAEHAVVNDKYDRQNVRNGDDLNPYYFMKDEIILKQSPAIMPGQKVVFHLADYGAGSRRPMTNIYTYDVEKYDDLSVRLKLADFKITIDEPSKQQS